MPQEDEELAQRMALRTYGSDMPRIEYASDKIAVISDYWGIAVYDLKKERLCRVVDLMMGKHIINKFLTNTMMANVKYHHILLMPTSVISIAPSFKSLPTALLNAALLIFNSALIRSGVLLSLISRVPPFNFNLSIIF